MRCDRLNTVATRKRVLFRMLAALLLYAWPWTCARCITQPSRKVHALQWQRRVWLNAASL